MGILDNAAQLRSSAVHTGLDGTIVAGSYNAQDGTAQIVVGETLALGGFGDPGLMGVPITGSLMVPMLGFQAGPQGGERAQLFFTRGKYYIMLIHGSDDLGSDAPGTPVGELWYSHAKSGTIGAGNTPVFDSGFRFTNDGPTEGDGLGGSTFGGEGALTQTQTGGGWVVRSDDTGKTHTITSPTGHVVTVDDNPATSGVTIATAGGLVGHFDDVLGQIKSLASPTVYTIVDGTGAVISHVAPAVGVGGLFGSLPSSSGAINNSILSSFGSNINSANLQTLINLANAMVTAGIPNASALIPLIVSSLIQNVSVPNGSSIVRIAS